MAKIDLEKLRQVHLNLTNKQSGGNSNNDFLKKFFNIEETPQGEEVVNNVARILPSKDEEVEFYTRSAIHRVEVERGKFKNYHCRRVHGESCPLCDLYFELWNEPYGSEDHKKLARSIKPRERYYFNVLDRRVEDASSEEAVKILSTGVKLFEKIISTMLDEDFGDITDPDTGHDFKFVRQKVDGWFNFDKSGPRPKSTPLAKTKKEVAAIMENLHDLTELVTLFEYDDVKECADILREGVTVSGENREKSDLGEDDDNYIKEVEA